MTTVVENETVAAAAIGLDATALAVAEHLAAARASLKRARAAAEYVLEITEHWGDLPRVGTTVAIKGAAEGIVENIDGKGYSGWDAEAGIEDAEELVSLVMLVVNDVIEKGDDDD
jgi:hypothetical protein